MRSLGIVTLALVVGMASPAGMVADASAQQVDQAPAAGKEKGKSAAPKKDAGELQKMVDGAIAAYDAGRIEPAVQQLTSALSAGGLPTPLLARALYYRGAAYRKQNKPAQAIADLTSALWLKNGLTESERKIAMEERSAAYRDAGLPDQTIQTVANRSAATAEKEPAAAPTSGSFFGSLFGGSSATPPAQSATAPAKAPTETASVAPAARPATAATGWQTATAEPKAPAATAPKQVAAAAPAAGGAVKGWSASTQSATGQELTGFRVQVATLRSRDEAVALAGRLKAENGADIGNRQTEIIETPAGSMGKVWRVKIGPFADTGQSQAFCAKIRNRGHDCMIVRE